MNRTVYKRGMMTIIKKHALSFLKRIIQVSDRRFAKTSTGRKFQAGQRKRGFAGDISISEGITKDMLGFERAQVYLPF
jgi:hypothetical protein